MGRSRSRFVDKEREVARGALWPLGVGGLVEDLNDVSSKTG